MIGHMAVALALLLLNGAGFLFREAGYILTGAAA